MRIHFEAGLCLNIIKLNGKLQVTFTTTNGGHEVKTFSQDDTIDTPAMGSARARATGFPVRVQDLELFVEQFPGALTLKFVGNSGVEFDFTKEGNVKIEAPDEAEVANPFNAPLAASASAGSGISANGNGAPAPTGVASTNGTTLTNGMSLIGLFDSFDEQLTFSTATRRSFKHIFVEGYRTDLPDNPDPEGRLHFDLAHREVLWESFTDLTDHGKGTRIVLDRIKISGRTKMSNDPLARVHTFGTHGLSLTEEKAYEAPQVLFAMDWRFDDRGKVFGNNVGTSNERTYFDGPVKEAVVLDAVKECLQLKKNAAALGS